MNIEPNSMMGPNQYLADRKAPNTIRPANANTVEDVMRALPSLYQFI